jgi:uncharacterized protein YbdZ (MbtH family)
MMRKTLVALVLAGAAFVLPAPAALAQSPSELAETREFAKAKTCPQLRAYLARYPNGSYETEAKAALNAKNCPDPEAEARRRAEREEQRRIDAERQTQDLRDRLRAAEQRAADEKRLREDAERRAAQRPPAAAPAPAAASYSFVGQDFRTLTYGPERWNDAAPASNALCEDKLMTIPAGWRLASAARTQQVARVATFGTHVLAGDGGSYYTLRSGQVSSPAGTPFTHNLERNSNQVRATNCRVAVLLEREGRQLLPIRDANGNPPPASNPAPAPAPAPVSYSDIGKDFRTLTMGPEQWSATSSAGLKCESTLTTIPSGWRVASAMRTKAVSHFATFGTHVLVGDGDAFGAAKNSALSSVPAGQRWTTGQHLERSGAQARTKGCSMVVLLEREGRESLPIRNANGTVVYRPGQASVGYARIGQDFRTLTLGPEKWSQTVGSPAVCESTLTTIPSGWVVAGSERTRVLTGYATFGTHVLVGQGDAFGSFKNGSVAQGVRWQSGQFLERSGSQAKVTSCSMAVLLEREMTVGLPLIDANGVIVAGASK